MFAPELHRLAIQPLHSDHEANAILGIQAIVDLHRQAANHLTKELQQYLAFVIALYTDFPKEAGLAFQPEVS